MIFKKKTVPIENGTKEIETVQTWEVRWTSRNGCFSGNTQKEVEVFISEESAEEFKKSLENAFELLKYTSGTGVTLEKVLR